MSRGEWLQRLHFAHCVIFKGEGRCFKVEETQFNLNFHQHCCSLTENTQIFTTLLFRWWEGVSFFEDEQQELYILCVFCVFLCLCCGCIEWGGGGFVECQTLGRVRCPQCHRCHKIWQTKIQIQIQIQKQIQIQIQIQMSDCRVRCPQCHRCHKIW